MRATDSSLNLIFDDIPLAQRQEAGSLNPCLMNKNLGVVFLCNGTESPDLVVLSDYSPHTSYPDK